MENTGKKIIVGCFQLFCNGPRIEMLKKAEYYMDKAFEHNNKIDLMILPEQFYQLAGQRFAEEDYGEEPHGIFEKWLQKCALQYHTNIIAGTYAVRISSDNNKAEKTTQKLRNRCMAANRDGDIVGYYDKIHLFDAFGFKESDTFAPGENLGLFDLDIGRVGVWICYDTRFPEISRALAKKGADFLCVPAAFYRPNQDQWEVLLKAAAVYNVLPVAAVNQIGMLSNGHSFFGRSMLIDPKGIITAGMSDKEGYFIGEIDLEYASQCHRENPEMQNRRCDLYQNWI